MTAVAGTPFAPDLGGALLFIEDVDEPLYRLDRMLTHLELSGSLSGVRAMIFGHLTSQDPLPEGAIDPLTALRGSLARFPFPLAWGLAAGHRPPNLTLPLGLVSRLEPAAGRLVLGAGASP